MTNLVVKRVLRTSDGKVIQGVTPGLWSFKPEMGRLLTGLWGVAARLGPASEFVGAIRIWFEFNSGEGMKEPFGGVTEIAFELETIDLQGTKKQECVLRMPSETLRRPNADQLIKEFLVDSVLARMRFILQHAEKSVQEVQAAIAHLKES